MDTIRRRLRRGEIAGRKEATAQGFRWLAALPAGDDAGSLAGQRQDGSDAAVVPLEHAYAAQGDYVATLRQELEVRNQEIARLHEVVERQALALERQAAALAALPATTTPAQDAPGTPEGPRTPCAGVRARGAAVVA